MSAIWTNSPLGTRRQRNRSRKTTVRRLHQRSAPSFQPREKCRMSRTWMSLSRNRVDRCGRLARVRCRMMSRETRHSTASKFAHQDGKLSKGNIKTAQTMSTVAPKIQCFARETVVSTLFPGGMSRHSDSPADSSHQCKSDHRHTDQVAHISWRSRRRCVELACMTAGLEFKLVLAVAEVLDDTRCHRQYLRSYVRDCSSVRPREVRSL